MDTEEYDQLDQFLSSDPDKRCWPSHLVVSYHLINY